MRRDGFTLIELVVVIAVLAILSITVAPRFGDKVGFEQVGFRDQVNSIVQFARKTAIASRRYVCVTANAGGVSVQLDPRLPDALVSPNCTASINLPGQNSNNIAPPSGTTLASTPANFSFDPLGRASAAVTLNVFGQVITVEQETGYVH